MMISSARRLTCVLFAWGCLAGSLARDTAGSQTNQEWMVEGVSRQALLFVPPTAKTEPTPVVFAFHGHGGRMRNLADRFPLPSAWPQAIVVYPQGLNTPGRLVDPEGKLPGWQSAPGEQGDRDLKFVDAMLAGLEKEYRLDARRLYATGHSNGGSFTYVLWESRRETFAAFAPTASALWLIRGLPAGAEESVSGGVLRPILHIAGQKDALVKFAWQERTMETLRKINHCGPGEPWGPGCTLYPSGDGAPVITYIHRGGHEIPADAATVVAKFFQQSIKPEAGAKGIGK